MSGGSGGRARAAALLEDYKAENARLQATVARLEAELANLKSAITP